MKYTVFEQGRPYQHDGKWHANVKKVGVVNVPGGCEKPLEYAKKHFPNVKHILLEKYHG